MKPPQVIETDRLRLRPPILEDAAAIFTHYAQDPEATKYVTWRPHQQIETTQAFLQRCLSVWAQETAFPWVMTTKSTNQLIGMVELRITDYRADLGYVVARPYWGQGFAPEAVHVLVAWALAQPAIYRVWAVCDAANTASARVLEKVGMQREGLLRRWLLHPNVSDRPRDCFCYAKVK